MTDADVDGSHIRTLLLTFFYRQIPELVERGHLYIAQPPLYKVKQGKEELYLKDDHELKQHLLKVALKGAELVPGTGETPLAAETFANVAREYLLAEAVIERLSRAGRSGGAARGARRRRHRPLKRGRRPRRARCGCRPAIADPDVRVESRADAADRTRGAWWSSARTTARRTPPAIDADLLASGDFAQIRAAPTLLLGLVHGRARRSSAARSSSRSRLQARRSTGCSPKRAAASASSATRAWAR